MKHVIIIVTCGLFSVTGLSQSTATNTTATTGQSKAGCAKGKPGCCAHASASKNCDKKMSSVSSADEPKPTLNATEPKRAEDPKAAEKTAL